MNLTTASSVSVVVRSLNEERHLPLLLSGLGRQTLPPSEIVLVDSGSSDSTVAIAERYGCRVIHISENEFSFGRALNFGLNVASNEIVVLASAHVYPVYDTWIEHLVAPFDLHDSIAISYGRQVIPSGGRFSEGRLLEHWFPSQSIAIQDHPFHNNANAAVRRQVWENLSYDEDLTGLEDLDFGKRAMAMGHAISYVAEAPVVHVHEEGFDQVRNRYRREAIAHKQIYSEQRMSGAAALRLATANVLGDLRAAASQRCVARVAADVLAFRTAQFLGTWQGFAQAGPVTRELRRRFYFPASPVLDNSVHESSIGQLLDYDGTRSEQAESQR